MLSNLILTTYAIKAALAVISIKLCASLLTPARMVEKISLRRQKGGVRLTYFSYASSSSMQKQCRSAVLLIFCFSMAKYS